jgi:hypothetical protein
MRHLAHNHNERSVKHNHAKQSAESKQSENF